MMVYRNGGSGAGLHGINAPVPTSLPLSFPIFYGVTLLDLGATSSAPAMLLEQGTGGFLRDLIVSGWEVGLEITGTEACNQALGSGIDVSSSIFFGNLADFSADTDCIDEVAFGTDPGRDNLFVDPLLLDPTAAAYPDLRPASGSPATTGAIPPTDGFFDSSHAYRGGNAPAVVTRSNIPWYAGWTRWF
ncbi:MAG: hypothetical protein R2882_04180 [Gemmatimonadales bacterium]